MNMLFFVPGHPEAIDFAIDAGHGQMVTNWTHQTCDQLAEHYPGVVLGDASDFIRAQEQTFGTAPEEITEKQYRAALHFLTPLHWLHNDEGESFKLNTFITGNITRIYAMHRGRYWRFNGVATLPHAIVMQKIIEHEARADSLVGQ